MYLKNNKISILASRNYTDIFRNVFIKRLAIFLPFLVLVWRKILEYIICVQ